MGVSGSRLDLTVTEELTDHRQDFTQGESSGRAGVAEVSRIGDEEMGRLMRQVVNRLYTFQAKADDLHFVAVMDRALAEAWRWDEPDLDETILSGIESSRQRAEEEGCE